MTLDAESVSVPSTPSTLGVATSVTICESLASGNEAWAIGWVLIIMLAPRRRLPAISLIVGPFGKEDIAYPSHFSHF
jgi:hypothetical protein